MDEEEEKIINEIDRAKRLFGKDLVDDYELVDQIAELNYKLQNMKTSKRIANENKIYK